MMESAHYCNRDVVASSHVTYQKKRKQIQTKTGRKPNPAVFIQAAETQFSTENEIPKIKYQIFIFFV